MAFHTSYTPSYLSIEDILATNERVPCKFVNDLPSMGFLDPSSDLADLPSGSNLELPLWLASSLVSRRAPLAVPQLPRAYREAYREILKAEASAVDLHKLSLFYYECGMALTPYDVRRELGDSLVLTFRNRFRHIMDLSQHSLPDPVAASRLERSERQLLALGQAAGGRLEQWCRKARSAQTAAQMVNTHLKRKMMQD